METDKFNIFSVMGPHAGEDSDTIFTRKIADIRNVGRTFWVIRSHKAKPDMVQAVCTKVCEKPEKLFCGFLAPSSPGGAMPTKTAAAAVEFSADRVKWEALPAGISPVTGKMASNTCALVFDDLYLLSSTIVDLWQYADFFDPMKPVKIRQGASTLGVAYKDTSAHPDKMKSHFRQVIAVGRLAYPFAVWLK